MSDTRLTDSLVVRCEALLDRATTTPIGTNDSALAAVLEECQALEREIETPSVIYKLRAVRHWLQLAYGDSLHGYPPAELQRALLDAISGLIAALRARR